MPEKTQADESTGPVESPSLSLLAQKMYGSKFVGEAPQTSEARSTVDDTEDMSEATDVTAEADHEESEAETEEEQVAPQDESEGDETESAEISTLDELIDHFELEPEWARSLKVPIKIDGVESEASVSDLVASYQTGGAAEKRLEDAKAKAAKINEQLVSERETINEQSAVVVGLIKKAESILDQESAAIDWKQLREDDPAEYSAKRADFAERRQTIETMKAEAADEYNNALIKQQEQLAAQRQQQVTAEYDMLLEKLPEWRDEKKAQNEKTDLAKYLIAQGFSEQDVAQAVDHRIILMARKAMLYEQGQKKTAVAKKKVTKIPKVIKPGTKKSTGQQNRDQITRLETRVRQTGKMTDAVALLKAKRAARQ